MDTSVPSEEADSETPGTTLAESSTEAKNEDSFPTQTEGSTEVAGETSTRAGESASDTNANAELTATKSDGTHAEAKTTSKPANESNTDSGASASLDIAKTNPESETPSAKIIPPIREWTHKSGRKLQASAVSYRDGSVELLREDGRSAFISLKDLSEQDRKVVYSQFAGQNAENTSPAELNPGELLIHNWTAPNSSKQVTAAILGISTDAVELMLADGRMLSIPIAQLSKEDQDYLKALTAKAK